MNYKIARTLIHKTAIELNKNGEQTDVIDGALCKNHRTITVREHLIWMISWILNDIMSFNEMVSLNPN